MLEQKAFADQCQRAALCRASYISLYRNLCRFSVVPRSRAIKHSSARRPLCRRLGAKDCMYSAMIYLHDLYWKSRRTPEKTILGWQGLVLTEFQTLRPAHACLTTSMCAR
eukprot:6205003-Pleurochrysis_carterae.AAC.1